MTTQTTTARPAISGLLRNAGLALVLSVVINEIIRIAAVAVLRPDPGFLALTAVGPVIMFTSIGVIGATVVYALLRRFVANYNRVFTIIATVVLVLSFIPNIALGLNPAAAPLPGANWPNVIVLMILHVPPALLSMRLLPRS